jgi:hypothetical protein
VCEGRLGGLLPNGILGVVRCVCGFCILFSQGTKAWEGSLYMHVLDTHWAREIGPSFLGYLYPSLGVVGVIWKVWCLRGWDWMGSGDFFFCWESRAMRDFRHGRTLDLGGIWASLPPLALIRAVVFGCFVLRTGRDFDFSLIEFGLWYYHRTFNRCWIFYICLDVT